MLARPLRVGFLGGVSPSIGGGGLELQIAATAEALRRRGHDVVDTRSPAAAGPYDVMHAFGSDVGVFHTLSHWRRNPCPLVLSPVLVVAPGWEERLVRHLAKIPWRGTEAHMRREVVRRADLVVCLSRHEQGIVTSLAPQVRSRIISNGVDPVSPSEDTLQLPDEFVLMLGTISRRKGQLQSLHELTRAGATPVLVGGVDSTVTSSEVDAALAKSGGTALGEVFEPALVREVIRRAKALVLMSRAEGQSLAILEAMAEGTPVVTRPLPSNRELARSFPGHIWFCDRVADLGRVISALPRNRPEPAPIPTWDTVAEQLEQEYLGLINETHRD
jgi:glycosyltransferase involved in cell wall biosynthesis